MSSRQVDNILDAVSPARIRSFNDDVDDLYTAQKLEYSRQGLCLLFILIILSNNILPVLHCQAAYV
jgi:hypothetical protein